MMKLILSLSLYFFVTFSFAQNIALEEVRRKFVEGASNKPAAENLFKNLSKEEALTPVLLAYKGASQAVMAKHVRGVGKKYSLAKKGMKVLHEAVSRDPDNIEIRFLRFSVQENVPSFLGLSGDRKSDKNVILENLSRRNEYQIDDEFFNEIVNFLIQSGECTEEEIGKLKKEAKV